jgi:hypothetical protein
MREPEHLVKIANYSVAAAYELISHASEISSKSGRTHSMGSLLSSLDVTLMNSMPFTV